MATGTTEFMDATTSDAFFPEVWSKKTLVAREAQFVFAGLVSRVYEADLSDYGDVVHVPSVGKLSTQTKNMSANAAVIFETLTETNTDVTINTWQYSAIALETAARRLANRDLLKLYAPRQGETLARSVDSVLAGLVDNFGTNIVGTDGVSLTYNDLLDARTLLDLAEVPMERVIVTSPEQEREFLKMDEFIHRDYDMIHGGKGPKSLRRAYVGEILDMPIYKTTHLDAGATAGHDSVMMNEEALTLVMAIKAETHAAFDINYLANKVVVEQLYGYAEMRDDHGVWLKGL